LAAAEPPPETTKIRLVHAPFVCLAPQYLAEDFLPAEGFTDWEYLALGSRNLGLDAIADGRADISIWDAHSPIPAIDTGKPVVVVAGVHGGCYQLFGHENVHGIKDLRGKRLVVHYLGGGDHVLLSSMLASIGVNPEKEVTWATGQGVDAKEVFAEGKADAFMAFAQEPAELRAKKAGRVILDTAQDRPWSQYFCCVVIGNREFVRRHPIATKRVLRAILKATDICAAEPERVARFLVDRRYETRYPIGLEVMKSVRYELAPRQSRGHAALPRAAAARRRHGEVDAAAAHRARHGLGVPKRAEDGIERIGGAKYVHTIFRNRIRLAAGRRRELPDASEECGRDR